MEILLSIIIPTYNRNNKVDNLLKMFDKQINDKVEIIVIDDGSDIPYKSDYKWVKIIRLNENSGGASVPRNVGLDNANGKYIGFCDADDSIKDNYIQKILDKTKEEWEYCYISWECSTHKVIIKDKPPKWNCCVWNCIYKRELIGEHRFNPRLRIAEDYDFNVRVKKGKKANITEILYYYEQFSPDSLVNSGIQYNEKYKEEI